MLLRLYSFCILMIDIAWVVINAVCAVFQAGYGIFRPPPLKSVKRETALVSQTQPLSRYFNPRFLFTNILPELC